MMVKASALVIFAGLASFGIDAATWGAEGATSLAKDRQASTAIEGSADPFRWLEDRNGPAVLEWVRAENERTRHALAESPTYARYLGLARSIGANAGSSPKFGAGYVLNEGWLYRLAQDEQHPRGRWERARLSRYGTDKERWESLLDLDELSAAESRNWTWTQYPRFLPGGDRCMIYLTDGGGAIGSEWREFDVAARAFPPSRFSVPGAGYSSVAWIDRDTLLMGARESSDAQSTVVVRQWKRNTPLQEARIVLRGQPDTVTIGLQRWSTAAPPVITASELNTSRQRSMYRIGSDGTASRLNFPSETFIQAYVRGNFILASGDESQLGSRTIRPGMLVAVSVAEATSSNPSSTVLVDPQEREAVFEATAAGNSLLVNVYSNARGRIWSFTPDKAGEWTRRVAPLPDQGSTRVVVAEDASEEALISFESYLLPRELYALDVPRMRLKKRFHTLPAAFDASKFTVEQFEARSKDGTRVPYFLVRARSARSDGVPVLMYAYGGNMIPLYPQYSGTLGKLWLEEGGAYVVAHIRGGGEFGPKWHQAALKEKRQSSYDDFIAVAEDLVQRRVTRPKRIGVQGFSNGGLVMAVAINQRPDLFGAAVIGGAVLDTLRVDLMSSSAVTAERGSPDVPAERAFLEKTSPYQNLRPQPSFPVPLLLTSTTDDVVHPAMTRKYAAKMDALHMPHYFLESAEGGHSYGQTQEEVARREALIYTYLWLMLGASAK